MVLYFRNNFALWVPLYCTRAERCGKHTQMLLLRHVAALSKESMDFPFCLFISIAVDTDFDFVTGELQSKVTSTACWFCLGVWWELQGTVERVPRPCLPFSDSPSSSWFRLVAVSKSPAAKLYSLNRGSEPHSVQLCQQSPDLHRNTVTLRKLVALDVWLVPGMFSMVLLELHPSLDCHAATGCMMWGAGNPYLPCWKQYPLLG